MQSPEAVVQRTSTLGAAQCSDAGFRCRKSLAQNPSGAWEVSRSPADSQETASSSLLVTQEIFAKCWQFMEWRVGKLEAEPELRGQSTVSEDSGGWKDGVSVASEQQ